MGLQGRITPITLNLQAIFRFLLQIENKEFQPEILATSSSNNSWKILKVSAKKNLLSGYWIFKKKLVVSIEVDFTCKFNIPTEEDSFRLKLSEFSKSC
jgi:hypothetical protein